MPEYVETEMNGDGVVRCECVCGGREREMVYSDRGREKWCGGGVDGICQSMQRERERSEWWRSGAV